MMRTRHPRPTIDSDDIVLTDPTSSASEATGLAALLGAARHFDATEPSPQLLAAMTRAAAEPTHTARSAGVRRTLAKALTAKTVALVGVVAITATGAAAATGTLPDAAQDGVSKAASHIGINLPDSASDRARASTDDLGPSEDNHGRDVSGVATETDATGAEKGSEISTTARDGHGKDPQGDAHTPGTSEASDNPAPVDTPNGGGIGTGEGASDGANASGADQADDAATKGSENAGRP